MTYLGGPTGALSLDQLRYHGLLPTHRPPAWMGQAGSNEGDCPMSMTLKQVGDDVRKRLAAAQATVPCPAVPGTTCASPARPEPSTSPSTATRTSSPTWRTASPATSSAGPPKATGRSCSPAWTASSAGSASTPRSAARPSSAPHRRHGHHRAPRDQRLTRQETHHGISHRPHCGRPRRHHPQETAGHLRAIAALTKTQLSGMLGWAQQAQDRDAYRVAFELFYQARPDESVLNMALARTSPRLTPNPPL